MDAVEAIVDASVVSGEVLWKRRHVVRAHVADGRSVIIKRPRGPEPEMAERFATELASLEYLTAMPDTIAPTLLGADRARRLLVMEELPPGRTLADSLLGDDRERAIADLVVFAQAIGRVHRWSITTPPVTHPPPRWVDLTVNGITPLRELAESVGAPVRAQLDDECRQIVAEIEDGGAWRGFVHGDPCPDNIRLLGDRVVIFDFELSGMGSVLLDASYLIAPFPTCWCFAELPPDVSRAAVAAYRRAAGDRSGFDNGITVALGSWVIARGVALATALENDREWGTTTIRPRLLRWITAFLEAAAASDRFPALRELLGVLRTHLRARWKLDHSLTYPALAPANGPSVRPPSWWVART